jgi:hypothetical protein
MVQLYLLACLVPLRSSHSLLVQLLVRISKGSFSFFYGDHSVSLIRGFSVFSLYNHLISVLFVPEIGDRVALSDVANDTDPAGSLGWIIENIDLFSTTMRLGASREVATVSNGSIARLRIINMNRSDKASVMLFLKFGIETPYQKIKVFHTAVEKFVYERPREWIKSLNFRATRVESDLGYIEYIVILQHREAWSNIGTILESRAKVASFCLELQKQLEMRYHSPPMPVELSMVDKPEKDLGCFKTREFGQQGNKSVRDFTFDRETVTGESITDEVLDATRLLDVKKDQ